MCVCMMGVVHVLGCSYLYRVWVSHSDCGYLSEIDT